MTTPARRALLPALALVLAVTALAYLPSLNNGFTNWDDEKYVLRNQDIRRLDGRSIGGFFTSFMEGNYHPLTMLSYALEYRFFGLEPLGYHAVNLALHLLNTALAFLLVRLLGGSLAACLIASLLFGIHPLHVESVAWISELKDVLSTLFYFGALGAYLRYSRGGGRRYYLTCLLLFVLSLLSKAMAVTFPLVMFLADGLLGRPRTRESLPEKVPFLVLASAFAVLALVSQASAGGIRTEEHFPLRDNLFVASYGLLFYLVKIIMPLGLSALYPLPSGTGMTLPLSFLLAPPAAAAVVAAFFYLARRSRPAVFGGLFFLITMLPVLQLVPLGNAYAADRYTYIPSLGLFYLAGTGASAILAGIAGRGGRVLAGVALASVFIVLASLTWQRTQVWHDSLSLWNDVLSLYPESAVALGNRGTALAVLREYGAALRDLDRALALEPSLTKIWSNRGRVRYDSGDLEGAVADYTRALSLNPRYAEAYNDRGNVYSALKQPEKAMEDFNRALALEYDNYLFLYNRGLGFEEKGNHRAALSDLGRALELNPGHAPAWFSRGTIRAETGDMAGAIADFNRAIEINPHLPAAYLRRASAFEASGSDDLAMADYDTLAGFGADRAEVHYRRGNLRLRRGDAAGAVADYTIALGLKPDWVEAYNNRGAAFAARGEYDRAREDFSTAVKLDPAYAGAYYNRGKALARAGRKSQALADFTRALELKPEMQEAAARRDELLGKRGREAPAGLPIPEGGTATPSP